MSTATTIYDVKIRYITEDQSSRSLGGIASEADKASKSMFGLREALALAGGVAGVKSLFSNIVSLGSQAENTQIAIAGMMQAGGSGGLGQGASEFARAMSMSSDVVAKMRIDARELPGEFEDLVNVFRGGLMGGTQAGKSSMEIEAMSARMMAVSKTLQIDSETAGREFAMMLEGRAGAHNTLFQRLHGQIGMVGEQFNKLTMPQKWALIDKALKGYDPAIKRFGDTWDATESTLRDFIKDSFRLASAPVFKMIGDEVKDWNDWLVKNNATVKEIVKSVGGGLVSGFRTVKDIVRFIVDHAGEIKAIAAVYIGIGAIGSAASGIGKLGGFLDGLNAMGAASLTSANGLANVASKAGLVAGALGALYLGLQYLADRLDDQQKKDIALKGGLGDPVSLYKRYEKGGSIMTAAMGNDVASFLESHKLTNKMGNVDLSKVVNFAALAEQQGIFDVTGAKAFIDIAKQADPFLHHREFGPAKPTDEQLKQNLKQPASVNITISKIEVASDDPDRFMVGLVTAAERALSNPTQARHVMHRAF